MNSQNVKRGLFVKFWLQVFIYKYLNLNELDFYLSWYKNYFQITFRYIYISEHWLSIRKSVTMGSSAELNLFAPDDHDDYDITNGDERSHNMKLNLKVWNLSSSKFTEINIKHL